MSGKTKDKKEKIVHDTENKSSLISPRRKKKLRQTLLNKKLKNNLLHTSNKAYTRTGRIGGK